jgi:hypothetical protein
MTQRAMQPCDRLRSSHCSPWRGIQNACQLKRRALNHERPIVSSRLTTESAVGDQRHVLAEARAVEGGARGEHLGHAGTALGPLVTDHHHIALFHRARQDALPIVMMMMTMMNKEMMGS